MTTTLSAKGHVLIPRSIRAKWGLNRGHNFIVLCSATGEILLRSVRRPGKSWIKSLRELRGLDIQRIDEPIRKMAV